MSKRSRVRRIQKWRGHRVRYVCAGWVKSLKTAKPLQFEATAVRNYSLYGPSENTNRWRVSICHSKFPSIGGFTVYEGVEGLEAALEAAYKDLQNKLWKERDRLHEEERTLLKALKDLFWVTP